MSIRVGTDKKPVPIHLTNEYLAYMRSPEWQELRGWVLERANSHCEDCGKGGPLDVHHLHYDTFMEEDITDLKALCRSCHEKADRQRKAEIEQERYDRAFETWAEKVYGEHWDEDYDFDEVMERFELWWESRQ